MSPCLGSVEGVSRGLGKALAKPEGPEMAGIGSPEMSIRLLDSSWPESLRLLRQAYVA